MLHTRKGLKPVTFLFWNVSSSQVPSSGWGGSDLQLKAHFETQSSRPSAGSYSWGCFAQAGRTSARALALPFLSGHQKSCPEQAQQLTSALLTMRNIIWHLCCWPLLSQPKYWSCCCNTEDVKRQGCCSRWASHWPSKSIYTPATTTANCWRQLQSFQLCCACDCGLRGLRIPCPAAQSPWHNTHPTGDSDPSVPGRPQERCSDLADMKPREKPGCCAKPWALLFPQPYTETPHVLYSLLGQQLAAVTLAWLLSLTLFSQLHGNWQQCKTRFGAVLLGWEASCSQPFLQNAEEHFHLKGEPKTSVFTHSHV